MRIFRLDYVLISLLAFQLQLEVHAQWIAVNDQVSGVNTATNATRYHVMGLEDGTNGPLRDLFTGLPLPVTLTISRSGFILADSAIANPAPDTPLYNTFQGLVDFTPTISKNFRIFGNGSEVTYEISGFNPAKTYWLQGGAVVGGTVSDRYTRFTLESTEGFVNAHSAGALTSTNGAELSLAQVAINTGQNHTPETGDMFDWREVEPGNDGTVRIRCQPYNGLLPDGTTASTSGYALTVLRVSETFHDVPQIFTHPQDAFQVAGESHTFSVIASGSYVTYQWFRNDVPIPNAVNSSYHIPMVSLNDNDDIFFVVVSNPLASVTSTPARLTVLAPPTLLLDYSASWQFEDSGTDPGPGWQAPNFDDTTWRRGSGPLGFESGVLPVPLATALTNHGGISYYFRTTFTNTTGSQRVDLQFTNMIDDGAVFYLNGNELNRVHMPSGPIGHDTAAEFTVSDAALEPQRLPDVFLQPEENHLAVEVHQSAPGSADMVFGTSLTVIPIVPTPLAILQQPNSLSVNTGQTAILLVDIEGRPVDYQWFKNNIIIPGATTGHLTITNAQLSDAGSYHVVATNLLSRLTSDQAIVNVVQVIPLRITGAPSDTMIYEGQTANFSGEAEGMNPLDWQWYYNDMPLAAENNPSLTLLNVNRNQAGTYFFTVSDMTGTITSEVARLSVLLNTDLRTFDHAWRYEVSGTDLGSSWRESDYDDSSWPVGPGPLGFETSPLLEPLRTTFISHGGLTYYFRTSLVLTNDPIDHDLHFTNQLDDGAVFYVNGQEFMRIGMPPGPINFSTPASALVGNTGLERIIVPATEFKLGTNILAVEVHQNNADSSDLVFGTRMTPVFRAPSMLSIVEHPQSQETIEGHEAEFHVQVTGSGARYQWFKNESPLPEKNKASLFLPAVNMSEAGQYHVVVSNIINVVVSSNATLSVLPPTPPMIVEPLLDQSISVGESVIWQSAVVGDPPLQFQWFKDSTLLPNATNAFLELRSVFLSDDGNYYFTVTNGVGSAVSDHTALNVLSHPRGEPGSVNRNFNGQPPARVLVITPLTNGQFYIGGRYPSNDRPVRPLLQRLHADGSVDPTFDSPLTGLNVYSITVLDDDRILVGGNFAYGIGCWQQSIVRLLPNGTIDPSFDPGCGFYGDNDHLLVSKLILQSDDKILAAGQFHGFNNVPRQYLIRLQEDGSIDESFDPGAGPNSFVRGIALQSDAKILIGGEFTQYQESPQPYLARLHPDGSLDTSFMAGTNAPNGMIDFVDVVGHRILVGGAFTSIAGHPVRHFAPLLMDGSLDPDYQPPQAGPNGSVFAVTEQPYGHLTIGGYFSEAGGFTAMNLARLLPDGRLDHAFNVGEGANDYITTTVMLPDGDLLVGGNFTMINGVARPYLAKLIGDSGPVLNIDRMNEELFQLSWLTNQVAGFDLERNTILSTNHWQRVNQPPVLTGRYWRLEIPSTNQTEFYRLTKP